MRATHSPSAARRRGLVAGLVTASVLALSVLGGSSVLANNPDWTVGHGTNSTATPQPSSGASSSSVAAGNKVGFFEWLRNDGTSNIAKLYLTATTTPAATVAGGIWKINAPSGALVRSGTCPAKTPLLCSFGAVNAGNTVYVTIAFKTDAQAADGTVQGAIFNWNANGSTTSDKNDTSRGDVQPLPDSVLLTANGDANGDFNLSGPSLTVADNQKLTGQNRQATSVTVNAGQVGAAVADGPALTAPPCDDTLTVGFPEFFSCDLLSSLTSVVEVGNGQTFHNASDGPGIKVLITFSQSPNQLAGANPFVYHYWETLELRPDGTTKTVPHAELITEECEYEAGLPTNSTPCLTVGNKNVTVWLFHNGPMRS